MCKHTFIKQYRKECRALRTEITINASRGFHISKRLKNLLALRLTGFQSQPMSLPVLHQTLRLKYALVEKE